jgi:hypothetical protein
MQMRITISDYVMSMYVSFNAADFGGVLNNRA